MLPSILLIQSSAESGLTFSRVLEDIPHDAAAIVVYAMLLGFVYLIWRGSRPKKQV